MILIARIRQLVQSLLDYIQQDCDSLPESQTFLYQMFWGLRDGSFDFYNQARSIFLRRNISPRKVSVLMEYPKDKAHFPCIVVREPRKTPKFTPLGGIGSQESFGIPEYQREPFTTITSSNVDLMCISDNFLESVLIGETLYALFEGARNTFEQEFVNFDFSMNEVIAENQLFPTPIIIKNINVNVDEESRFASILHTNNGLLRGIRFIPEPQCPYNCQNTEVDEPEDGLEIGPYFEFAYPYVWLRKEDNKGEQEVLSSTDWKLYVGQTYIGGNLPAYPDDKPYFTFRDDITLLNEWGGMGYNETMSNTDCKLEQES